jgi:G:T/U-mismatch repair DNA glycosylase
VNTEELLAAIDQEIVRLQDARNLLAGLGETKRRGRPPGTVNKQEKRTLSEAARQKIAEAQRKRWAAQKRQSP